jgi:O-antigen ligase
LNAAALSAEPAFQAGRKPAGLTVSRRAIGRWTIALTVFLGGFVIREPAPYEVLLIVAIVGFMIFGMRLSRHAIVLATLFVLFNVGGLISMYQMADYGDIPLYLAVSFYLGLSSVFFCALIEADMTRLRLIFRAYVAGAVITGMLGILGYFHAFPGSEIFTRYDRAMGAFQDPNVFAPFLVAPALYLCFGLLQRGFKFAPFRAAALLILMAALFLAFSRAAWGLTVMGGIILYILQFASERSPKRRMHLVMMAVGGLAALVVVFIIALQFEAVSSMFEIRAKAVQDYDGGNLGRFARHAIGFEWALEKPLGIGPLEFGVLLGEDTHNIWVKALMAYGWLGFVAYLCMAVITLVGPLPILLKQRPWTPYLQVAYATFVGHMIIAWVIDVDHWRHVYLLIGVIWGCMGLEVKRRRELGSRSVA